MERHASERGRGAGARGGRRDRSTDRDVAGGQARRAQGAWPLFPDRPVSASEGGPRPNRTRAPMSGPVTNDLVHPVPRTEFPKARALEFDFLGLEIGVAEYEEGPTGCTVFSFGRRASVSVDVRGGSPDVSAGHREVIEVVCFAGGSLYGLEASAGAAAEFFAKRGYSTKWTDIALVSGAILFDYGRRPNAIYPDKELGRAAVRALRPGRFPLGAHGAGSSATAGHGETAELSGQGAAFRTVGKTRIAVFTVVNAYGAIVDRAGRVVRGNRDARGQRQPAAEIVAATGAYYPSAEPRARNTTLTLVVTDQRLDALQLRSVAR